MIHRAILTLPLALALAACQTAPISVVTPTAPPSSATSTVVSALGTAIDTSVAVCADYAKISGGVKALASISATAESLLSYVDRGCAVASGADKSWIGQTWALLVAAVPQMKAMLAAKA